MTKKMRLLTTLFLGGAAAVGLFSFQAAAQASTADQCPIDPNDQRCLYGYYDWQVDQASATTTFTSETGFSSAPGLISIPVQLSSTTTIHEVHGHFAYAVWNTSCIGSIIAEVKDQNGNIIAAANPLQFGSSTVDVPIKGTFPNGLSISSLQMVFYQGQCGTFTFSWSLTMS